MINFTEKTGAVIFGVRVSPESSTSEIAGEIGGALKIKLKSPPVDGAANAELIKLLSKTFGVSKSAIEIVSGQTSKNKQLKITDISAEDFLKSLEKLSSFPKTICKK